MKSSLYIVVSSCIAVWLPYINYAQNPYELLQRERAYGENVAVDRNHAHNEFQVNLVADRPIPDQEMETFRLQIGVPAIGHYQPGYPMRLRYVYLNVPKHLMARIVPQALWNQVKNAPHFFGQIMVHGLSREEYSRQHEIFQENNLIFHPFAYAFMKQQFFSTSVPMGIFNASGIAPASSGSITFNNFKPQGVNPHTPNALSPNNARFKLSGCPMFCSFWSAAYSQNKQYATATYHLLINNRDLVATFEQQLSTPKNIDELLMLLWRYHDYKDVDMFIKTIIKMIFNDPLSEHHYLLKLNLDYLSWHLNHLSWLIAHI